MARAKDQVVLSVAGHDVTVTHPGKVVFPEAGHTKLDMVRYYLAVAEGAVRGVAGRPMALKRYVEGAGGDFFFQKRAPESRPPWMETVTLAFPSGRTADEVVVRDAAQLAWVVNLGCIDLNPHPVRADDLEHPDELRIDLDPVPGVPWGQIREVALVTRAVLADHALVGWPKTSGSRGIHVNVRIERRWDFGQVRRAALAIAREVERRAPAIATSKWWKEERHGVFLDYNQNAKDRTVASAWSVRPTPDARVSAPLSWDEVADAEPGDFTLVTMPARFAARGDAHAGIDEAAGSLDALLDLSARQEAAGEGDAPWPPHYAKQPGEPARVAPSRKRRASPATDAGAAAGTGTGAGAGAGTGAGTGTGAAVPEAPSRPRGARRRSTKPLVEIARAAAQADALAGLERWKARHPAVVPHLQPADVLVDAMRGRYTTWTRIRVNLEHVPEAERPAQEPLDPDYDPWAGFTDPRRRG
ncbi:MAG TPA: DNA polymerase domain-containing protein [Myxococcota bacterium]|nr:DNA polymerase domain-containing protein [Myxococcota bacterium]